MGTRVFPQIIFEVQPRKIEMSKVYTTDEVSQHTSAEDCWLIIENKVYDVTNFLSDHPGGGSILLDVAGRDSTDDFDAVGHTDAAKELLERFYIGDLKVDPNAPKTSKSTAGSSGLMPLVAIGAVLLVGAVAIYGLFFRS